MNRSIVLDDSFLISVQNIEKPCVYEIYMIKHEW